MNDLIERIGLYLSPSREFVRPYILRELGDIEIVEANEAKIVVAVISPDETLPTTIGEHSAVLCCPNVIGTGMSGLPMQMVHAIARSVYFHIAGNEARISSIHASDVAKAVRLVIGKTGHYVVTDGISHTVHDLTEALAWRLDQKRIYTLKASLARWIMNKTLLACIIRGDEHDGSTFANKFDFKPTSVVEYLRTHVYDDESL